MIERKMYQHMMWQINNLSRFVPRIISLMSHNLLNLQHYFEFVHNKSCDEVHKCFQNGIINSHLCVNAFTSQLHTEMDGSYTLITVPKQPDKEWQKVGTQFQFHISADNKFLIPMHENVCFLFSGYMLTHNQKNNIRLNEKGNIQFVNIATYANKRLFDNMKKSFKRRYGLEKGEAVEK